MRKLVGCCVALAFSACGRTPFGDGITAPDGSAKREGGLTPSAQYPVGVLPSAVRAGHLDEDGVLDLMTST